MNAPIIGTPRVARALVRWFSTAARDLPWRRTRDPYAIWIAEVMLQQTTVAAVVPHFTRWMREVPTLGALAAASPQRVYRLWEGLGYYRRAENLLRAARIMAARPDGLFPRRFAEVLELPGIGRYTAGAICSIAFDEPTPVLDGNVIRVLARLRGLRDDVESASARARLWQWAQELVAAAARFRTPGACGRLNEALMEVGATICTPRTPRCPVCPLRRTCIARRDGSTAEIPRRPVRPRLVDVHCAAVVFNRNTLWYVRRRPEGAVNARLWEFPQIEVRRGHGALSALKVFAGLRPDQLERLGEIKHTITRSRIRLEIYRARSGSPPRAWAGQWRSLTQIRRLPFSSAHRRIAGLLPGTLSRREAAPTMGDSRSATAD